MRQVPQRLKKIVVVGVNATIQQTLDGSAQNGSGEIREITTSRENKVIICI